MVITIAGRSGHFRKPDDSESHLEIVDQYAGNEIEYLVAGAVTRDMSTFRGDPEPTDPTIVDPAPAPNPDPVDGGGANGTTFVGTVGANVMTGTDFADTFVFTSIPAFTTIDPDKGLSARPW